MIQRNPTFKFDLTYPRMQPQVYQRLGEKQATDIVVQILNDGKPFSLTGVRFGFELRNDKAKIIIDTNQLHFSVIDNANGIFRYRVTDEGFGYIGNAYLAYFTLTISDVRITTERFRFHNDEDVQVGADGLQEHYVSVIDDLVASNAEAIAKAQEIKAMIESNQVVKKSGDTMTGNLLIDRGSTGEKYFGFMSGNGSTLSTRWVDDPNNTFWVDATNNQIYMQYRKAGKMFLVNSDTNLLKKTGDTMTGELRHRYDAPSVYEYGTTRKAFQIIHPDDNKLVIVAETAPNSGVWDWSNQLRITDQGTIETAKDGDATLVLTADGENPSTNIPPKATRRGNTVTVNGSFQNKVGSASTIVTILPTNMRPATAQDFIATATDGTHVQVHINPNGNLALTVKGKNVLLNATYVVN